MFGLTQPHGCSTEPRWYRLITAHTHNPAIFMTATQMLHGDMIASGPNIGLRRTSCIDNVVQLSVTVMELFLEFELLSYVSTAGAAPS